MSSQSNVINLDDVVNQSNTSGLGNTGATCYINTAIQCLGYCSSFLKYIIAGQRSKSKTPLTDELREIYIELWIKQNSLFPHKFLKSLHDALHKYIDIHEQNDITEFLMLYIDKLNADLSVELIVDKDDINELKRKASSTDKKPAFQRLVYQMDIAWLNYMKKEYSPLVPMFHGQQVSQIICGHCNYIHHNYETFGIMSIPLLKNKDNQTLDDLLASFFKKEIINSQGKEWTCDKCNHAVPSPKCIKFWKTPTILIISLKRFDYTLRKNSTPVALPIELNLQSYCLREDDFRYRLCAIANHSGCTRSGHYSALCRHKNDKWYDVDDHSVREANANDIRKSLQSGYVYFYESYKAI